MKVLRLMSENIKRIKVVNIEPGDAALVTVAGRNGAGKSSVLDSVAYALGGEKLVPSEPIRAGEAEAKIVVDLGDLIVTRKFNRKRVNVESSLQPQWSETTSTLSVTNKDGARYPSPQAVLDKLLGTLTFDPLAFARADEKAQDAILRKLVNLDVSAIEARRKDAFDRRAMLKKTHQIKSAQLDALPVHKDAPASEVPLTTQKLIEAEKLRKVADDAEREVGKARGNGEQLGRQRVRLETEAEQIQVGINRAMEQLKEKQAELSRSLDDAKANDAIVASRQEAAVVALALVPDVESISAEMTATEATNVKVRANQRAAEVRGEVEKLLRDVGVEHQTVLVAEAEKQKALTDAQFPVPGLGLSDDGVTFNNVPFSQAGSAEQVRVSVAIGIALNPQLKVLLIRNGNLLDQDSLKAVSAQAEAAGMQIWMEWVGEAKDGVGVTMVDGEVA